MLPGLNSTSRSTLLAVIAAAGADKGPCDGVTSAALSRSLASGSAAASREVFCRKERRVCFMAGGFSFAEPREGNASELERAQVGLAGVINEEHPTLMDPDTAIRIGPREVVFHELHFLPGLSLVTGNRRRQRRASTRVISADLG